MNRYLLFLMVVFVISLPACRFFVNTPATPKSDAQIKALYGELSVRPYSGKTLFALVGKPGAGKGTLVEQCERVLHCDKLSTGDLCRTEVANGTHYGKNVAEQVGKGMLIPDNIMTNLVDGWLAKCHKGAENIILDGYPRTFTQAEMMFKLLKTKYPDVTLRVVELNVSDAVAIDRLTNRLICKNSKCQLIFNRNRLDLICPGCTGVLAPRADDKASVIQNRLAMYKKDTDQLLTYYKAAGFEVEKIDVSNASMDDVYYKFMKLLPN